MKGLLISFRLLLGLSLPLNSALANEILPETQLPPKRSQAEYRVYDCDSNTAKYWVNKNSEGFLVIYDHPSMQTPKLEVRDGRIYRPNGFFPLGRITIIGTNIFRFGETKPLFRLEKILSK
jgi:hypothetical protein